MNDGYGDRRSDAEREEYGHDATEAKKGRHPTMKLNPMNILFGGDRDKNPPCCWR